MPPKDLPGFYYDVEKNRYFPIHGPIPGSKRSPCSYAPKQASRRESFNHVQTHQASQRNKLRSSELLRIRELHGRSIISNKCRCSFEEEYNKLQASRPVVRQYQGTRGVSNGALEQLHGIIQTPQGLKLNNILATGDMNGVLSLYDTADVGQQYGGFTFECMSKSIWPLKEQKNLQDSAFSSIWCLTDPIQVFTSGVSSLKRLIRIPEDGTYFHAFFGSGGDSGSVYILNLGQPRDRFHSANQDGQISHVASFDRTIWTADCNPHKTQAVIGTNRGGALINLESENASWFYRTKSDIFSQQFVHSGNVVLCGHRNGAIISVDIRQKQPRISEQSADSPRRPNPRRIHRYSIRNTESYTRHKYELRRKSNVSDAVFMSSAVCSLVALQSDEQYFLASSMDGSIELFDLRLLQRGAVQSYAGHVNSHTHVHLGVNPSETLVISGGEDCFLRTWSIKTGELVFGEKVSDSILTTICWPRNGSQKSVVEYYGESYPPTQSWATWLGSPDGLFYMHGI